MKKRNPHTIVITSVVFLLLFSFIMPLGMSEESTQNYKRSVALNLSDGPSLESVHGWPVIPDPECYTSRAGVGDVDLSYPGDEIFVGYQKPPLPGDPTCYGVIWMWHADGVPVSGWDPKIIDTPFSLGSEIKVDDLDDDGDPEVIIATENNTYSGLEGRVYVFSSDGTIEAGWPQSIGLDGGCTCPPVIADINNDGQKEIIVSSLNHQLYLFHADGTSYLPGVWPKTLDGILYHAPAVANVDEDPELEIIVDGGYRTAILYAFNHDGTLLPENWPYQIESQYTFYTPSVGDVNNDGEPEIVVGAGWHLGVPGKVYVFTTDGTLLNENWPKEPDPYPFTILLTDLNPQRPGLEIITAPRYSDTIYAWYATGDTVEGWPYTNPEIEQIGLLPSLGDVDGDSTLELVTSNICTGEPTGGKIIILQPDGTEALVYGIGKSLQVPLTLGDVDHDGTLEIIQSMIDFTEHNGPVGMWRWKTYEAQPQLTLAVPSGFSFGVSAVVHNSGDADATNVSVKITVTGGLLGRIKVNTTEEVSLLAAGDKKTVSTGLFVGLGPIEITVTATCEEGISTEPLHQTGTQLIIISKVQ